MLTIFRYKDRILGYFVAIYIVSVFFLFSESENNIVDIINRLKLSIAILLVCFSCLSIIFSKPARLAISINFFDSVFFLVVTYTVLSFKSIFNNADFLNLLSLVILYITIRIYHGDSKSRLFSDIFISLLVCCIIFHFTVLLLQAGGYLEVKSKYLAFNNSGKAAVFLVILLSINLDLLLRFFKSNSIYRSAISLSIFLSVLIIILVYQSLLSGQK